MKREFMEEALDSTGAAKVTICFNASSKTFETFQINLFMFRTMWEPSLRWWTSSLREERKFTGT